MLRKPLFLFVGLALFFILLISVVSADYSIDSFSRKYSGYGGVPWYDVIDNENVIISADKSGMNYFSTEGDWLPINSRTNELKLNINGEKTSYGKDPISSFKVKYKIYGDAKVNIQSKTWGNHGDAKLDRVDEFQRESDTSILINSVSQTINLGDSYQIQRKNWVPPGCGGSNYNSGYSYINVKNVNSDYFEVELVVYEYDEECDSAYVKINSYIERVPFVCGNNVLEDGEECDDGNLIDEDGCSSICEIEEPEPPECYVNVDCGTNYYSQTYCEENETHRHYYEFYCILGTCQEEVSEELILTCDYMCIDGECIDEPEPICGNDVLEPSEECDDGNLINGDGCDEFCVIEPEPPEPVCYSDLDCGIDYCLGGPNYCLDNNVYQDFKVYTCNNPGQTNAYCSDEVVPWLLEICDYMCVNGECIDEDGCSSICEIEEPEPPECYIDSDCGTDYYDDKYCSNRDVYQDYHDFFCGGEECGKNIISELFEECEFGCENGECVEDDDDDDEDDKDNGSCNNRELYNNCRINEVADVLIVYKGVGDEVEIIDNEISLIGQSQEKITDNSWILYLFIGICGLMIVLILIVLGVRK